MTVLSLRRVLARTVLFLVILAASGPVRSQTAADSARRITATPDTTLPQLAKTSFDWRRPIRSREAGSVAISSEALRYYAWPISFAELMEETGSAFPLILSDEGYGRESFLMTSRPSEPLATMVLDGVLPITSVLNGAPLTNYFPMEEFSGISLQSGAGGLMMTAGDYASSDIVGYSIERFRAPLPYSRIHYTQDLARSTSVFDGLFSLNASAVTNIAIGLSRRSTGRTPQAFETTFNPRTDIWSIRGQASFRKYLSNNDSLRTSANRRLDGLLWVQYTTAFNGINGGLVARDSINMLDPTVAPVLDPNTFEHRVRLDGIAEIELPFLAEARTKLGGFATYESRRILSRDTTIPSYVPDVSTGRRYGASLSQPLTLAIGDFLTRAQLIGDVQRIDKDTTVVGGQSVSDTRLSLSFSDSLALKTALRVSLFGFVRTVQSNLKVGDAAVSSKVFPAIGLAGTVGFSDAVTFSASYHYAKDRAALSPSPNEEYLLRNIGAFLDLRFPLSRRDSIALHFGVLDRNEPEGIVADFGAKDSLYARSRFSSTSVHSQAASIELDAYVGRWHIGSTMVYFPEYQPDAPYTLNDALVSSIPQKFFGQLGVYYENEVNEGNLRLSLGLRGRFLNRLDPWVTYDRSGDYYTYRGAIPFFVSSDPTNVSAFQESRLETPKAALDLLVAMEIDRRAQLNVSFLNILSTPFANVQFYPRPGFHWRLDATWAFLD